MSVEESDAVTAKYKKLLSMARSSLEANQASIGHKDEQIRQLLAALDEEKKRSASSGYSTNATKDMDENIPRQILCRVDVDDFIWILIEYEDMDDEWKTFQNETALEDFIQRIPGAPVTCPSKCLTVEESIQIEESAKRKLDRVVEEFRRFRVRSEIANKQQDAERKQVLMGASPGSSTAESYQQQADEIVATRQKSDRSEEIEKLQSQLREQEATWKNLYDKTKKENDILRSKGGESLLATQWRNRYESCLKDREALNEKLKVYTKLSDDLNAAGMTIEQAYTELQEEYKEFRHKVLSVEQQRLMKRQGKGGNTPDHSPSPNDHGMEFNKGDLNSVLGAADLDSVHLVETSKGYINSTAFSKYPVMTQPHRQAGHAPVTSIECKIQYVRHMVLKYLTCRDPEVKLGIEGALVAIFRLSERERLSIEHRRKEDATNSDAITAITSFLGEAFSMSIT